MFSRNPAMLLTTLAHSLSRLYPARNIGRDIDFRRSDVVVAALNKSTNYSLHSATIGFVLFSTRPTSGTFSEPVCGLSFTLLSKITEGAYLQIYA